MFWDGADLLLGAMRRLFEREGEREKQTEKYQSKSVTKIRKERYVCMNNA